MAEPHGTAPILDSTCSQGIRGPHRVVAEWPRRYDPRERVRKPSRPPSMVVCTLMPQSQAPAPRKLKKGDHVFLIDGSSFIFRAYFAMFKAAQSRGRSFTRSDGKPTGAVLTFCNMLWKLLRGP